MPPTKNQSGKRMWPFSDVSLEWATWWGDVGNLVLLISLIAGVAATFVIVRSSNVKEAHWDADRHRSSERIAALSAQSEQLRKEAAEATAGAARANEEAAKAHERTAALEKEAAAARLETERLKQAVAWRSLSDRQAKRLGQALSGKPGSVNLRFLDGDPEAMAFAAQLSRILTEAKWRVAAGAWKPSNTLVFGLFVPEGDTEDERILRDALTAAGVRFSSEAFPSGGVGFNLSSIWGAPTLMVGSRPPLP